MKTDPTKPQSEAETPRLSLRQPWTVLDAVKAAIERSPAAGGTMNEPIKRYQFCEPGFIHELHDYIDKAAMIESPDGEYVFFDAITEKDQQITDLQARVKRLEQILSEVLASFGEAGHPGEPCLRSSWVNVSTIEGWRKTLAEEIKRDQEGGNHEHYHQ